MKILSFYASNIKRLQVVEITPKDNVVEIAGKNGHGKTSVLDSIMFALAGKGTVQKKPIRDGENKAMVRLKLGGDSEPSLVVTRRFNTVDGTEFTTSLTVEAGDGFRPPSPQSLLDSLMDPLSIDPLDFQRMAPKDRVSVLKKLVPDVDFDALARQREKLYQKRLDIGRERDIALGAAKAIELPDDVPEKHIETGPLLAQVEEAGKIANAISAEQNSRNRMWNSVNEREGEGRSLKRRAEAARAEAERLDEEATEEFRRAGILRAELEAFDPLPEMPDLAALRAKLKEAETVNRLVALFNTKADHEIVAKQRDAEWLDLTDSIEAVDEMVRKAVAEANLPVRGMSLGEDDVYLDNVPFDQAADSRQLRASVAVAMAKEPELRIIRIRDGSLLDGDGMDILAEVAEQEGWQIWIERVEAHSQSAVVMEEGRIKSGG